MPPGLPPRADPLNWGLNAYAVNGQICGVAIPAKHWACRDHWLLFPVPFRCNANRYRRGTPQWDAMIERANKLLANEYSDLQPPWRR